MNNTLDDNTKAVILVSIAAFSIPASDAIIKYLSSSLAVGFITATMFIFKVFIIYLYMYILKKELGRLRGEYIILSLIAFFAIFSLFLGLKYLPLANNIALFFVEPLILVAISSIFLKEIIKPSQLIAVILGLVGALIIIRPNWSIYGLSSLFPIISATFFAIYLAYIRKITQNRKTSDILTIQFWIGIFGTIWFLPLLIYGDLNNSELLRFENPLPIEWVLLIFSAIISTIVHLLISKAFKISNASNLAPYQYLEIVGGVILGYLFFSEIPDIYTIIGALIIVLSGIYLYKRK